MFWGYPLFGKPSTAPLKPGGGRGSPSAEFFREPRASLKNTSVVTMKVVMIIEAKIKLAEQSPPSNFDSGLASTFE